MNFQNNIENPLAKITLEKWENQLTKPNEYRRGHKFKFLVHAINTTNVRAIQNAKSRPIISTSLITDEFQGTYKESQFGFIYQPTLENVLLISSSDCYADDIPFCTKHINAENFSLTTIPIGSDKFLHYTDNKACKTMHIEEIENGSKSSYNEIVLIKSSCSLSTRNK